jgi:hypothetical protein
LNTHKKSSISVETIRFAAAIATVAFLNIGLYFILYFFAPLIAGLICGVILRNLKRSIVAGYIGSIFTYFPLFIMTSDITVDILTILIAAGIISLFGGLGSLFGSLISRRYSV